ncbi:hypothetical protein LX36DRAFT_682383 [Colletotrichum falcatum]|nr:hypothetical protein LX36DRAFT_682383 [Colletotrichum falcatum]
MASSMQTVPAFEDAWIECLGDLARYRMSIEDENHNDREARDKAPTTGRLYHHLAILARPNALQQLFYYAKSLCVPVPFLSSRESIMTLFDPHLNGIPTRLQEIDAAFVRAHGVLFSGKSSEMFAPSVTEFIDNLDGHIEHTKKGGPYSDRKRRLESSYYIAIALGCAMLEYSSESNVIMMAIKSSRTERAEAAEEGADWQMVDPKIFIPSLNFLHALNFATRTYNVVFRRFADPNANIYLYMPWKLVSLISNELMKTCSSVDRIESKDFPRPSKETPRPLPEDFVQHGLLWVSSYYPDDWFTLKLDDDEKYIEADSMTEERKEKCLWLACCLASSGNWLTYDKSTRQFGVPPNYDHKPRESGSVK